MMTLSQFFCQTQNKEKPKIDEAFHTMYYTYSESKVNIMHNWSNYWLCCLEKKDKIKTINN